MMDKLAEQLGISKDEQRILDSSSGHRYECRCEMCRRWWQMCGPEREDDDDEGTYGPFTKAEIEAP
jgi:hypothetical protein